MNPNIRKERYYLQFLSKADRKQEKLIIRIMTKSQMTAICSILYNALHGTFSLKRSTVDRLKTFKKQLRSIVDKNIAISDRRELMIRRAHEIAELLRIILKDIFQNVS